MRHGLVAGHNVDAIDIGAGLSELAACGYTEPETRLVIEYALERWKRGEEEAAQRGALDAGFHGISATCWLRVLAAARANAGKQESSEAMTGGTDVGKGVQG